MRLETEATLLATLAHGEHGAIVRAFTPASGVRAGYVRGGRSRRLRPVLVPGNRVHGVWRARTDDQLAQLAVELVHSRAFLFAEPLPAAAIEWVCALTATALPEGQPYPALASGLEGLLDAIEAAPSARGWSAGLVRYELLMLAELGFGADRATLGHLAPALLGGGEVPGWTEIFDGLALTGRRLARDLLVERQAEALIARERLVMRLRRVGG